MIVSSWVGVILVAIMIILLSLIVWALVRNRNNLAIKRCQIDSDCPSGFFCGQISKTCVLKGTCEVSNDCPNLDFCSDGRCVECLTSFNCPLGSTCLGNRCSIIPCQNPDDCPTGFTCNQGATGQTGTCLPPACQTDQDCRQMTGMTGETGEICYQGFCVEAGIACSSSQECYQETLLCINNQCLECLDSSNCLFGETCVNNFCVATTPTDPDNHQNYYLPLPDYKDDSCSYY